MQGVPGSGKSTVAQEIADILGETSIISTDDFWYQLGDGEYAFNPDLLGRAHKWNQARCAKLMVEGEPVIIVDNTNIKKAHVKPYLMLAEIFDYEVAVRRVVCDPVVAFLRGKHSVPFNVITRMADEMETLDI